MFRNNLLPPSPTIKMERAGSSEILVHTFQTTPRHIPVDVNIRQWLVSHSCMWLTEFESDWNETREHELNLKYSNGRNFFFSSFVGWDETESAWYVGHCLAYCGSLGKWVWSIWWNENWQGKPKCSEETCIIANSSTTNPTWQPGNEPGPPRWEAGD
jgi:hypothetical protein